MDSDDVDDDMMLLEDYQVADFASSMLAAISCWHSRARALLSLGDPTVRPTAASSASSALPPPPHQANLQPPAGPHSSFITH